MSDIHSFEPLQWSAAREAAVQDAREEWLSQLTDEEFAELGQRWFDETGEQRQDFAS